MKKLIKSKTIILSFSMLAIAAACPGLLPGALAVVPAPDGGYPGGNTAEGQNALFSLTGGFYNTAVGIYSLLSLTNGDLCTGVGAGTLLSNIADENTATGAGALLSNTTGEANTANGAFALFSNTAAGNTAIGSNALSSNTTGGTLGNTQGFDVGPNVAVGWRALESNTIASANTAVGYEALGSNTTGLGDSDLGLSTAVGFQALANASGPNSSINDGFGYQALFNLTTGIVNTAIGAQALFALTTGSSNVAIGTAALDSLTTGDSNIALGNGAGSNLTTGNDNILIGFSGSVLTADNVIAIGNVNPGATATDSCYISNIWNQAGGSQAVYVSSDGKLGLQVSSRRFKDEIRPMERASEIIYALKPVSFRYKKEFEPTHPLSFGLVAEEVAEVNPELVMLDKEGKPVSVRYDAVNAMLLNEFLKEHQKVEEQAAAISRLESTVAQQQQSFRTSLAEQHKQIEMLTSALEKVSAAVETSRAAPQVAVSNP